MSIFDRIKNAIFGEANAAPIDPSVQASKAAAPTPSPGGQGTEMPPTTPSDRGATGTAPRSPETTPQRPQATAGAPSTAQPADRSVDVEAILNAAVKKSGQKLDWRHSIVDLMKALGMDASREERRELAEELGYDGDMGDSARMNMFLHKALLRKLSDNGGKVPAELLD